MAMMIYMFLLSLFWLAFEGLGAYQNFTVHSSSLTRILGIAGTLLALYAAFWFWHRI
jgi:hypothetical protein